MKYLTIWRTLVTYIIVSVAIMYAGLGHSQVSSCALYNYLAYSPMKVEEAQIEGSILDAIKMHSFSVKESSAYKRLDILGRNAKYMRYDKGSYISGSNFTKDDGLSSEAQLIRLGDVVDAMVKAFENKLNVAYETDEDICEKFLTVFGYLGLGKQKEFTYHLSDDFLIIKFNKYSSSVLATYAIIIRDTDSYFEETYIRIN